MEEKLQKEQFELLYKDLPNLIHKILTIRTMPGMCKKELLNRDIEQIKKITSTECENVLSYLK